MTFLLLDKGGMCILYYIKKTFYLIVKVVYPKYSKHWPYIVHTACISFWIPKRQAISTDNGFIFKKKLKLKYKREKKISRALSELGAIFILRKGKGVGRWYS